MIGILYFFAATLAAYSAGENIVDGDIGFACACFVAAAANFALFCNEVRRLK